MCGIAGYISKNLFSKQENLKNIIAMISTMNHRGPDSEGTWISDDNNIIFGHKRLSILDLSKNGHQPMHSDNGRFTISFNGEIYNHLRLRKDYFLGEFKGTSDTETLLKCFEALGINKTLEVIDGMFAIALHDHKENNLYLFRDRFGEKPLYYSLCKSRKYFVFSSEVKAITKFPAFCRKVDVKSLAHLLDFNYIGKGRSIYDNVDQLKPSHFLKLSLSNMNISIKKYWNRNFSNNQNYTEQEILNKVDHLLTSSIKDRLISDVPIGCFLSGGIDSSLVTAIISKKLNSSIKTFSIGFENKDYNEAHYAKNIANYLGTNHHEMYLSKQDYINTIYKLDEIYDEPFGDSSQIPTTILSKFAKKTVTVCLTGDGGDELFYGYDRYQHALRIFNFFKNIPLCIRKKIFLNRSLFSYFKKYLNFFFKFSKYKNLGNKLDRVLGIVNFTHFDDVYFKIIKNQISSEIVMNAELNLKSVSTFEEFDLNSNIKCKLQKILNFDQTEYLANDLLVKIDRASMYSSLEARSPFLNKNLFEFCLQIPSKIHLKNNQNKYILQKILEKYLPKKLFQRPKMGFSVPIEKWIHNELCDWSNELMSSKNLSKSGLLNVEKIQKIFKENSKGKNMHHHFLWSVLMFQSWYNKNIN